MDYAQFKTDLNPTRFGAEGHVWGMLLAGVRASKGMYCSPFREDRNPSCRFVKVDGHHVFCDLARQISHNMFTAIKALYPDERMMDVISRAEACYRPIDFDEAPDISTDGNGIRPRHADIRVIRREWDAGDEAYWKTQCIPMRTVAAVGLIVPIDGIYVDGQPREYLGRAYATVTGTEIKVSFVDEAKENRFKGNTSCDCIYALPRNDTEATTCFVSKSIKEAIQLRRLGVGACYFQHSEYSDCSDKFKGLLAQLCTHYSNVVFVKDADAAGQRYAARLSRDLANDPAFDNVTVCTTPHKPFIRYGCTDVTDCVRHGLARYLRMWIREVS